ncbi:MAG: ATP-dependent DNA helicase RecG [Chloroflexi bacterium]|nr:ATP-dependent DNA helicase RecG [Chloroflexota bacterium]
MESILRLELERGCEDTAVSGGLDRFLQRLGKRVPSPPLRDPGLLDIHYAALTPPERQAWAEKVLLALRAEGSPTIQRSRRESRRPSGPSLDSPVTTLRSVNSRVVPLLRHMELHTIQGVLYLFPNRHSDFSRLCKVRDLVPGQEQTAVVTLWEARQLTLGRSRMKATEAVVGDDTGNIRVIWFNRPYLARTLKPNCAISLSGRVTLFQGHKVFESPEYELLEAGEPADLVHTGRLVPVYPTTEGLPQRTLRRVVREALDRCLGLLEEPLPADVLRRLGLLALREAVQQAHYPDDEGSQERARRRLAFDELLLLQIAALGRRQAAEQGVRAIPLRVDTHVLDTFIGSLPFALTGGQQRALDEILADLQQAERPMARMLQGDVGSGKTVVALAALLVAVANGYQGAMMAPTEVLAEQHFLNVSHLLGGLAHPGSDGNWVSVYLTPLPKPVTVGLLVGSLPQKEKEALRQRIAEGTIDILIGTHALIQEEVEPPHLALAVVDEQHRFGVLQRAALRQKGEMPHLLVMSATPIPRTLALTLYADLDVSTIQELPSGRRPIKTYVVPPDRRASAYKFIREQVKEGRQAFIIYPLIDESDALADVPAAVQARHRLAREEFPDLHVGLLHGRMPLKEKQEVMERFRSGEMEVLVATPVVEVGIDVPNATVMLVEGADRFGLAQLHQLRGRVGRGQHESYCFLLADSPSQEAKQRLQLVRRHHDGFALAEEDLRLRGPGDLFGTRQSGLPTLRIARLSDRELLAQAREEALRLLKADPGLKSHPALRQQLQPFTGQVQDEKS